MTQQMKQQNLEQSNSVFVFPFNTKSDILRGQNLVPESQRRAEFSSRTSMSNRNLVPEIMMATKQRNSKVFEFSIVADSTTEKVCKFLTPA
jgi:hypothetical protein